MPGVKGKTNNPNGRPPKKTSLSNILDTQLKKTISVGGKRINGKKVLADLIVQGVTTGRIRFPNDTEDSVLSVQDWMTMTRWIYQRVDGRPPQALNELEAMELQERLADTTDTVRTLLNATQISPDFFLPYREILDHKYTEYVFRGGRGSTKSSFVSLAIITLIKNNPGWHALVLRQVAATIRDSVFSQLIWAINYLDLENEFSTTVNPLEITYKPTGQKIYFRGGDDPMKVKSIKPKDGYINILWYEELDQFRGETAVRSIQQSALRGGDSAYIFKSFNPPRSINNWVYKSLQIPKKTRLVHDSSYVNVPEEWLGRAFIDEAEYLKEVNPSAYEHEYLGIPNSAGGMVFENVEAREITDEEIYGKADPATGIVSGGFDHIYNGLDFGYYPDPAHYVRLHYDAARREIYIFSEVRSWKDSNRGMYDKIVEAGYIPDELLIADSAEPKSIADYRAYGATSRPAEKGAESVKYGIQWLQRVRKIIIDPVRCPYTLDDFLSYEYERTKDGEIMSGYPDKNNDAIDAVRYALNRWWIRRGQ